MKLVFTTCECASVKRLSGPKVVARFRTSHVSAGAAPRDVKSSAVSIRRDMVRMRRHLMIEGQREMAKFLREYFEKQLYAICNRVEELMKFRSAPVPNVKAADATTHGRVIWEAAVTDVVNTQSTVELVIKFTPIVQSIAAKALERTSMFLGETPPPNASVNILRRAQDMARQVTRINETTRKNLIDTITGSIERGDSIQQTIQDIRAAVPEISSARIPTIARTEVGNAVDHGTKEAIKNSSTVATVEVIGCKAVEPGIPTFDGRPTCNIQNVPAARVDELRFHINHTGAIVPQSFRE